MTYTGTICFILILTGASSLSAANESLPSTLKYDPFEQPDFLKAPARTARSTPAAAKPNLQLRSILQAGDESMINLNGKIMMIGDSYKGYKLMEVDKQSATFIKNGKKTRVTLQ
jgi:predicted transcriptional regulator with HTH domain